MKKLFTIHLFFIFPLIVSYGQLEVQLYGTIVSENNEPIINANVRIPELGIGTTSDLDGNYMITVPLELTLEEEVHLKVSFIGFKTQTVKVLLTRKNIEINFTLLEDIFESETVVVTGIASKTSKSIAEVAVSRLDASEKTKIAGYQTMSQLVTGKLPGVQLKHSSGNVGSGFRFYMRSGSGINGDEQPAIYVDGIRVDDDDDFNGRAYAGGQGTSILANLNPEDIESIDVLKGPAGAAMYGTSGSNGVVLINTKFGETKSLKDDNLSLNYKYGYGINTQSYNYSLNDFKNAGEANKAFKDGIIRHHNLSVSGGMNILRYFASFDSRFETGIINENQMDRNTVRLNVAAYPSKKVNLKFNAGYTKNEIFRPQNDNSIFGYLINTLLDPPYLFVDKEAIDDIKDEQNINQLIGSANISYSPITNLEANFTFGIDASSWRQETTFPYGRDYLVYTGGLRSILNRFNSQITYDFNVRYKYKILNDLNFTSIVGSQLFERKVTISYQGALSFNSALITNIGAGSQVADYGESASNVKTAGIFTEHTAEYLNTYYLTLAVRNDYASSIGKKAPDILYPKCSFAIRLDKFNTVPKLFDLMKLRLAYGESGILPDPLDPISLLWTGVSGGYGTGAVPAKIGNNEIKPERIKEVEIGLDLEIFRDYSFEISYYKQFSSNSIVGLINSPSTGLIVTSQPFNVGAIEGWGIETHFQAVPIRQDEFRIDLQAIWNYQTNKVTDLGGAQPIYSRYGSNVIKEGLPKHEFYTHKVLGAKYNTDGIYAGPEVTEESVSFGNPIPDHTGSFTFDITFFRNLNLNLMLDWALNNKMLNLTLNDATKYGSNTKYNQLKDKFDGLTPGTAEYRKAANQLAKLEPDYDGNYIEDADYIKLREISISYNFKNLLEPFYAQNYIRNLVIGLSASNVWTSTKYSGADVEINWDRIPSSYSLQRGIDLFTLQNPRVYYFWMRIGI